MNILCDFLHNNFYFHWNEELETLFQQIKASITKDFTLTLPKTNHAFFFITVDYSFVAIGCVLFQMNDKGKLDVLFYNS